MRFPSIFVTNREAMNLPQIEVAYDFDKEEMYCSGLYDFSLIGEDAAYKLCSLPVNNRTILLFA